MRCYGLTGGIACGKSVVADLLRKAGIPVIDADQLAREVVKPGSVGLKRVVETFGPGFLDQNGVLDRKKLGALVFKDGNKRLELETILHPLIGLKLKERLMELEDKGYDAAVYEAPLIFEKNLDVIFDGTILVTAPAEKQIERILTRDSLSKEQAEARIAAQMSEEEKITKADVIIDNSGNLEDLDLHVSSAWKALTIDKSPG